MRIVRFVQHKEEPDMNSLIAEKQYQIAKWADIIKSCKICIEQMEI